MIVLRADLHTHTLASGHAYSTVKEMAEAARDKELELIALTDHGKGMEGAPLDIYFVNLVTLPRQIAGVTVLRGIEANIMDMEGSLDVGDKVLLRMDWVIASLHSNVLRPSCPEEHTEAYLSVAENPFVDMIGHPDTPAFAFDMERVIQECAAREKIVELNSHHAFRLGDAYTRNARRIVELCRRYGARIAVNSDAHVADDVGETGPALALLQDVGFPEELVLNSSARKVLEYVDRKRLRFQ